MGFKYKQIGKQIGFGNILETILENRGVKDIKSFLTPTISNVEDINNYDNINKWTDCFIRHINKNSRICIIVDSDYDGFSSASFIYQYIKLINPSIEIVFLTHVGKAHGVKDLMDQLMGIKDNIDLLIIPDASSNDFKEHSIISSWDIDILIADHHEVKGNIYSEKAIVVNNQLANKVTNKSLTGVGVIYKLCKEIDKRLNVDYADRFLDLVSVGMIADVSDLTNLESRYLVNKGIEQIKQNKNYNKLISKLIEKQSYSMGNKVTIMGIAFYICPLINAMTRMGTIEENRVLFEAMCNIDRPMVDKVRGKGEVEMTLQEYAIRKCETAKRLQKKSTDRGVEVINQQIEEFKINELAIIVCKGDGLEKSLTGLVANKIASQYQKPCILLKTKDNYLMGSGRGFERNEIQDLRQWCIDTNLFEYAEGHANAMGVSIHKNKINDLYNVVGKIPTNSELIYSVDGIYNGTSLNKATVISVANQGDIWGTTVKEPLFAIEKLQIDSSKISLMGSKLNTIKFSHNDIDFIKFNTNEEEYKKLTEDKKDIEFVIIGKFSINEYNGNTKAQILIENMSYSTVDKVFRF